jgi:hypothetical protein
MERVALGDIGSVWAIYLNLETYHEYDDQCKALAGIKQT